MKLNKQDIYFVIGFKLRISLNHTIQKITVNSFITHSEYKSQEIISQKQNI